MSTEQVGYTDEQLTTWREAVIAGGLPTPWRSDRWQVMRAGVVNLWEFEQAEYWYADGWVQLTGRNETGKSSLMALTTLIPWLGDTSTTNIDTLGGSGKQFRYYVEPTTLDGDRRDASSASSRGWLWVEYARMGADAVPEFFTTLGYAEARRASATLTPRWCTVHGPARVRAGIELVEARAVRSPKEVTDFLAAQPVRHVLPHVSGAAYRAEVADVLLGAEVERLETVGKMLRVARTPKLGESLNASFVTEKLRDALPGLERGEVEALAEGWDQLDRARRDLTTARENLDALKGFVGRAWLPYVRARLRQGADAAAAARSAFDGVTRRVRESTEALATAEEAVARLAEGIAEAEAGAARARDQREAHLRSRAFLDAQGRAQNLEHATERTASAREGLEAVREAVRRAEAVLAEAIAELAAAQERATERASELDRYVAALLTAARAADVPSAEGLVHEQDWSRLGHATHARTEALRHLEALDRAFVRTDGVAQVAEERAASLRSAAEATAGEAETAWTDAEDERSRLATALAAWAGTVAPVHRPAPSQVDGWVAGLPREHTAPAVLAESVRADWLGPLLEHHADERRRHEAERDRLDGERRAALTEIEQLHTTPEPVVPQPILWRRSARADRDGAPFWSLVDPRPEVGDDVLAHVEAALAAMGILDAWVSHEGFSGTDSLADLLLTPPEIAFDGPTLADVLTVAEGHEWSGIVGRALAQIRWGTDESAREGDDAAYRIAPDGTWVTPMLSGRAAPLHSTAELIGESARRAARERRIAALTATVAELDAALESQRAAISERYAVAEGLRSTFALLPDQGRLMRLLATAHTLGEKASRQQKDADGAASLAAARRAEADAARADELDHAREHALPVDPEARAALARALAEVRSALGQVEGADRRLADARETVSTAERRRASVDASATDARDTQAVAERRLRQAEATESALRAAIDDSDAEILSRADLLAEQEQEQQQVAAELGRQHGEAVEARGSARARLEGAEAERAQRAAERDASFGEFWRLVDTGLAEQAMLELEGTDQRTIEATRDQVAVVRDRVGDPRGWGADASTQADVVRRAVHQVGERLDTLRAGLEAGGRTARLDQASDPAQVSVVVEATGTAYPPREALSRLEQVHGELASAYDESVQNTLTELLGSTFIEHLRDRLTELRRLTARINEVLARHPTGTTRTRLRIHIQPAAGATEAVLDALEHGEAILDAEVADRVRDFLRGRIEEARAHAEAGGGEWPHLLAEALDYRRWFSVTLQKKTGDAGRWTPLTPQNYAHLSGGGRVVMLMLPFVATLTALYEAMPSAPRPFWLDEAFDGLDTTNRATVLALLEEFDLDVLVVGPGRLLNSAAVPVAAIYQVVRAEDPLPGADLAVELWAGGELTPLEPTGEALAVRTGDSEGPSLFSDLGGGDGG